MSGTKVMAQKTFNPKFRKCMSPTGGYSSSL